MYLISLKKNNNLNHLKNLKTIINVIDYICMLFLSAKCTMNKIIKGSNVTNSKLSKYIDFVNSPKKN